MLIIFILFIILVIVLAIVYLLFLAYQWNENQVGNYKYVQEHLIDTKIITKKQYDAFKNKGGVYKITIYDSVGFPKGFYIGESNDLIKRLCYHMKNAYGEHNESTQKITKVIKNQVDIGYKLDWTVIKVTNNSNLIGRPYEEAKKIRLDLETKTIQEYINKSRNLYNVDIDNYRQYKNL